MLVSLNKVTELIAGRIEDLNNMLVDMYDRKHPGDRDAIKETNIRMEELTMLKEELEESDLA